MSRCVSACVATHRTRWSTRARVMPTLADGTVVEAKGNEDILYDGEVHSAANLYDALKEGYYGKL